LRAFRLLSVRIPYLRRLAFQLALAFAIPSAASSAPLAAPPNEKFYQGFYYDEALPGSHDVTEHDVTRGAVERFEQALETKAAWVYFSANWMESRAFPAATCRWIRELGKVPYIRLMLRSDLEQNHSEKLFNLANILAGTFDDDLKRWARDAKSWGAPILIEWGTEPNGDWFSWNGKWNGKAQGAAKFIAAYRHIVDLMRAEHADNLQWVWHVNWFDVPEAKWNRFENYFPGRDYCDWMAVSVYGALTPRATDGLEGFRQKMDETYPRLTALAPDKPIIVAEFGCDIHHRKISAATWAGAALNDLFARRWPKLIGFSWWNESWENDDVPAHNTDMIILHDRELTSVFREELAKHAHQMQESPIFAKP
jgi:hypothetical protein